MNGQSEMKKSWETSENKTTTAETEERTFLTHTFPILAFIASLSSTVLWTINLTVVESERKIGMFVLVIISPVFISAGWITNFLSKPDMVRSLVSFEGIFLKVCMANEDFYGVPMV